MHGARPGPGPRRLARLVIALFAMAALAGCTDGEGGPSPTTAPPTAAATTQIPTTDATRTTSNSATTAPGPGGGMHEGFEAGLAAWAKDSHVPDDPGQSGQSAAWDIDITRDPVHNGTQAASFFLDGSHGNATIWIERRISVPTGAPRIANVSIWAWSPSASFDTRAYLVSHLGPGDPGPEDFPGPAENSTQEALEAGGLRAGLDEAPGWMHYNYTWAVPEGVGSLYLAVGVSAVWESQMTFFVDDVVVAFE